ncbi:glycosyltransferase family 4 protein [Aneurinibacillus danicus]|uniref:Glycosyl transferase family 1 domain-containing protein n=1 Tax=Aneurinibacillus danicus TaxID=267746 RepID=A0A511VD12_9BACL|nr:glycosyltransferase family 4 protein [Aneurinibacillus danicus]GEN36719.1 hypothetical protein ADA01nite_41790 [Aneurinibacillus danicus]
MDRKPIILLLVDRPGWAFDIVAHSIVKHLSYKYDFIVRYVIYRPDLSKDRFDILYVFFWGETYHRQFIDNPKRVIKEVSSHRWENEGLTPKVMVEKYLVDADTVVVTSKRLQKLLASYCEVYHCPTGFEPASFYYKKERTGHMQVGWAGNQSDPCKGLHDIIIPACQGRFSFRMAGGSLSQKEMVDFYNSIDVLCVASTAEGEPLPLIEGMACGVFPVCTNVGIVPELIKHGANGLIIERSVEAFIRALMWCNSNLQGIRQIGKMNAISLAGHRTWKSVIRNVENVLSHVAKKNGFEKK